MKIIKYVVILAALVIAVMIVTNLTSNKTDSSKSVVVNIASDPGSLDVNLSSGTWEHQLFVNIFEGLVSFDTKGKIVPAMASSWFSSNGGKRYTFTIRDSAWSDGTPVTAHDFEFSMKRVLNPTTAATYSSLLYIITGAEAYNTGKGLADAVGVKALDDKTLQIDLTIPAVYFVEMLEHPAFLPLPKHVVEKNAKNWNQVNTLVYNGAYKLTEWKLQSHLLATKNPHYYDTANVAIENIKFVTINEAKNSLKAFRSKEIDFSYDFPADELDLVKKELDGEWYISPYTGIYFYSINMTNSKVKALAEKEIRQALAMSIDRDFLVKNVTKSGEIPAYSIVPTSLYDAAGLSSKAFLPDWVNLPMEGKILKAKEIMNKYGYSKEKPLNFDLSYNTSDGHKRIAIAVAKMWEEIGAKVNFINADVNVHYGNLQNSNFDVGRAGWIADYQEPSSLLYVAETGIGNNYAKYSNKEVDRLMKLGKSTLDQQIRFNYYLQAEKIVMDEMPMIPLYFYVNRVLSSKRIKGFEANLSGVYSFKYYSLGAE